MSYPIVDKLVAVSAHVVYHNYKMPLPHHNLEDVTSKIALYVQRCATLQYL